MSKVSVIIPARNERFLQHTIDSVLAGARGAVEVIACLDGYWPDPPLKDDPRVRVLHWTETLRGDGKTEGIGMRECENRAAAIAEGEFLMKLDAHCILAPGWDEALKSSCLPGYLVVPTRHSIDPATWTVKLRHFNYHILTYPYLPSMYGEGLHAVTFAWDLNKQINAERAHIPVDDLMSFQGSCWFQRRADFERLGPLDSANYYFYQEAQEVGLRVWMTGGRCVIDKTTWYAHLHKGREQGRGFWLSLDRKRKSEKFAADFWLNDRWPGATRTFVSLVEQFWPLIERMTDPRYAWPPDWREFAANKAAFDARPADQLPAHL